MKKALTMVIAFVAAFGMEFLLITILKANFDGETAYNLWGRVNTGVMLVGMVIVLVSSSRQKKKAQQALNEEKTEDVK